MNRHEGLYATRSFHQPFLSTTTHSHIPRITMYPETPLILVDDFATREITKPPIHLPRDTKVSATGCWRMNNTMAALAGHFLLFDNGHQNGDGTYSRESYTLMSNGSTPSQPPPPTPTPTTNIWQTANRHNMISRSFPTTSKQQQQDRIRSSVRHELMTKTSSPPLPPPYPS